MKAKFKGVPEDWIPAAAQQLAAATPSPAGPLSNTAGGEQAGSHAGHSSGYRVTCGAINSNRTHPNERNGSPAHTTRQIHVPTVPPSRLCMLLRVARTPQASACV